MKIHFEEIDARIAACLEAWRTARKHCAALADEAARPLAERVADRLRDDGLRECLAPLFKHALKHKKK